MTEGTQIRDFSPVEQAAQFFFDCATRRELTPGDPNFVNFGSGAPKALIDYAKEWWEELGAAGSLLPGAIPQRPCEVKKITPLLLS